MPYCPSCRLEYRPGFTRCPDCDKALVDHLPEPPPKPEEPDYMKDWVPVAQFATEAYAVIIADGAYIILVPPEHVEAADREGEAMLGDTWRKCRMQSGEA